MTWDSIICPINLLCLAYVGILCYFFQGEIDAHEDSFQSCAEAGEHLVKSDHYAADDVREKVWTVKSFTLNLLEVVSNCSLLTSNQHL